MCFNKIRVLLLLDENRIDGSGFKTEVIPQRFIDGIVDIVSQNIPVTEWCVRKVISASLARALSCIVAYEATQ